MANVTGMYDRGDAPQQPLDVIPAGKYVAAIVESKQKATKDNQGSYLELTWEILDGPYKGRKVWSRLNLHNKSAQAVQIARGEFAAIRQAVGVIEPKDSEELHRLPCVIIVKCKKRKDSDEMSNEIKGYERKGSGSTASPPSAGGAAPWKR